MADSYPYGYAGQRLSMAELESKATIRNLHPEFWRRLKAMLIASGGTLGVGTAWRSSDIQRATFLQRHNRVVSGGCCGYEGGRYALKGGMAHAAPPGRSFHESVMHGYAAALDAIGDLTWMHQVESIYGFKDFRNVGNEPWHIQFIELPNSVSQWISAGMPHPRAWDLPGDDLPIPPRPQPGPDPTPPTPQPPGDEMSIRILESQSNPKEFNAVFFAECDAQGRSIEVQWSGDGSDPRVMERIGIMDGNFGPRQHVLLAGLKNNRLHAKHKPSDINDSLHTWTDEDFAP